MKVGAASVPSQTRQATHVARPPLPPLTSENSMVHGVPAVWVTALMLLELTVMTMITRSPAAGAVPANPKPSFVQPARTGVTALRANGIWRSSPARPASRPS